MFLFAVSLWERVGALFEDCQDYRICGFLVIDLQYNFVYFFFFQNGKAHALTVTELTPADSGRYTFCIGKLIPTLWDSFSITSLRVQKFQTFKIEIPLRYSLFINLL